MIPKRLGWLDKLPASVRHLAIVAGATFGGDLVRAIVDAQGVTAVAWGDVLVADVNHTAVAVAVAVAGLWLTPLTRQYGLFAQPAGDGGVGPA